MLDRTNAVLYALQQIPTRGRPAGMDVPSDLACMGGLPGT